jgi:hypothetical protein
MNNSKINYMNLFNKLQYDKPLSNDDIKYESFADYFIDDIDIKKLSPERFEYYKDLIEIFNKKPSVLYNILKKYYRFKNIKEKEKKLLNELAYNKMDDNVLTQYDIEQFKSDMGNTGIEKLKNILMIMNEVATKPNSVRKTFGGDPMNEATGAGQGNSNPDVSDINNKEELIRESKFRNILKKEYDISNLNNLNQNIIDKNDYKYKGENKLKDISDEIDRFNDGDIDEDTIKYKLQKFENDPNNQLNDLQITIDDRLVFILSTFFIRYFSVILIQWCIDINLIKTFDEGFMYYAAIYLSIFWFIVLFVNIENRIQIDYMNFDSFINSIRSLFYYYYMGTNGITRLFVHSCILLVLLLIPIILNIKQKNSEDDDDDDDKNNKIMNKSERTKLIKSLSLFTIYIWILTSIIAMKF